MHVETIGPLDVLIRVGIFEKKPIRNVPVDAGDEQTHADAVDNDHPDGELDHVEKTQTHHQTEQN